MEVWFSVLLVERIALQGMYFIVALWVVRKNYALLSLKGTDTHNGIDTGLYHKGITKENIACFVFMCLFAIIGVRGVVSVASLIENRLSGGWGGSHWQVLSGIIQRREVQNFLPILFSIPFSLGMIVFLAFKAVGRKQEPRNGISAELVYSKHISKEYIACILFACYFGLHFIADAFYAVPLAVSVIQGGTMIQNRLGFVLPLFITILFSLGMLLFFVFKAKEYGEEKKQGGIDAGIAYYKHILGKHTACIALICLLAFGGVVSVLSIIHLRQIMMFHSFWLTLRGVFATSQAPILIPLLFSLATAIFLAFKAKQYGKEKAAMPEFAKMLEDERQAEALKQAMATGGYATPDKVSYFDGRLIQLVGWCLLGSIVLPFSLGFAFPWWLCKVYGWKVKHTIVEGKRLKFNGTGMSLFGHYILWSFLTIITLGIFGWWLVIFVNKWLAKNTTFADAENESRATASTENLSCFDGRLIQFVGWGLLGIVVIPFSLGFALPWWLCKIYGWKVNHSVIEGKRLKFNGTGMSLFGHYILWSFLTIITLGIYGWWLIISVNKWLVKNTFFAEVPTA